MKQNAWEKLYSLQRPQRGSNRLSSVPSLIPSGSPMEKFLSTTWMVSNADSSCTPGQPLPCLPHRLCLVSVKARVYEWVYRTLNFDSFTPIMPGWFMENMQDPLMQTLLGGFPCNKDKDGYFTCSAPLWGGIEDVPWVSITDDFGDMVHGIFLDPIRWNHRPVQAVADPMSFGEMTRLFSLGKLLRSDETGTT